MLNHKPFASTSDPWHCSVQNRVRQMIKSDVGDSDKFGAQFLDSGTHSWEREGPSDEKIYPKEL